MTVKEFYAVIGGDYEGAVKCLGDDLAIKKWLLKLSADPCFQELQDAMSKGKQEEIARAANTLKALSLNLSLTKLGQSSRRLEDAARSGITMETLVLFHAVEVDYAAVVSVIDKMLGQIE